MCPQCCCVGCAPPPPPFSLEGRAADENGAAMRARSGPRRPPRARADTSPSFPPGRCLDSDSSTQSKLEALSTKNKLILVTEGSVHASDSAVNLLRATSLKVQGFGGDVTPVAVTVNQDVLKDEWANGLGIIEVPSFVALSHGPLGESSRVLGCSTCTVEVLSALTTKAFGVEDADVKLKSRGGLWIDPEFEGDFLLFGGATPRSAKTHVVSRIAQKMKGPDYEEVGLYLDLLNECEEEGHDTLREEYTIKASNISLVSDPPPTSLLKLSEEEREAPGSAAKRQWDAYAAKRDSQSRRFKALFHLFGEIKYHSLTDDQKDKETGAVHQLTKDAIMSLANYGFSREDFIDRLRRHTKNQPKTSTTAVRKALLKVCEDMLLYGDDPAADEFARLAALPRRNPIEELQYQAMEKLVNLLAYQEDTILPDIEPGVFLTDKEKRQKVLDAKKKKEDAKKAKDRAERKAKKTKKKERKLKKKSKKGKKKKGKKKKKKGGDE